MSGCRGDSSLQFQGKEFLPQLVKGLLDFGHGGGTGGAEAVGIVPELFLVDAGKPLQGRLGENFAVHLKEGTGVHPEYDFILSLQFFRNGIAILYTGLLQNNQAFLQVLFYLIQRISNSASSTYAP